VTLQIALAGVQVGSSRDTYVTSDQTEPEINLFSFLAAMPKKSGFEINTDLEAPQIFV